MGLFKKARELSVLCGATVAALAFSPAGKPMPFDDLVLEALINLKCPISPEPLSLVEVDADAEASPSSGDWEIELLEAMDGKSSASPSGDWESEFREAMDGKSATFWWERADVQCMGLEELRRFEMSILGYKEKRMRGFDDLHEQRLRDERLLMDSTPCSVGSSSCADPILDDLMLGEEKRMKGFDDLQEQRLQGERLLMDSTPCSVGSSSSADPILNDLMLGEDGWFMNPDPILDDLMLGEDDWLMNTVEEFEEWLMNKNLEPADPCTTFSQQQQPPSSALDAQILQLQQPAALEESIDDSAELLPTPTHLLPSFVEDGYISIWDF